MFSGRTLEETPLVLDAFAEALEETQSLRDIDLSDNAFGPAGAKPLMRLLSNNRNIQYIRLNNNGLGRVKTDMRRNMTHDHHHSQTNMIINPQQALAVAR